MKVFSASNSPQKIVLRRALPLFILSIVNRCNRLNIPKRSWEIFAMRGVLGGLERLLLLLLIRGENRETTLVFKTYTLFLFRGLI